jgi:hypothetical protein
MGQWDDRIRNHNVWSELQSWTSLLDQAVNKAANRPETIEPINRIRVVVDFVRGRLNGADAILTPLPVLNSLAKGLRAGINELQAFVGNGNVGHLENVNSQLDGVLQQLAQLWSPPTSDQIELLANATLTYRTTLDEQVKQLKQLEEQLSKESNSVHEKLNDLVTAINTEKQQIAQTTTQYQGQFSTAQEARTREFSALLQEFSKEKLETIKKHEDSLQALELNHEQSAASVLQHMEDQKEKVEKLLGIIGNLGLTAGYVKRADYARTSLWVWQGVVVLSLVTVVIAAVLLFIPVVNGASVTWESIVARLILCISVGVLAAYAGAQADRFFEIERRNRQRALELEALGPYLAPLPEELQDKFRIEIGDRSFGREDPPLGKGMDRSPATLVDVLLKTKDSRQFVREVIKDILDHFKIRP